MWRERTIEDAADIISGGTPSRDNPKYWGGHIPWVTPTDITSCKSNYLAKTVDTITDDGLLSCSAKMLPIGTILLTSRATIGEARIALMPLCTNQGFKNLKPKHGYNSEFLFYQACLNRGKFERYAVGSTFPEINRKDTARVTFDCPDEPEQKQVAEVLTTIDTAIEKTEELIAKYERIKKGMMQDLFTRGLDEAGRLRPPPEEAPDHYHETELGLLPKGWTARVLDKIIDPKRPIVYGILMPGTGYEGGVPVIIDKDIQGGKILEDALLLTSPEIDFEYRRSKLLGGDILLTIRGSVGRIATVPQTLEGANITQDTARIAILDGEPGFYRYFLESDFAQAHFDLHTLGQAVQGINLRDVRTTICIAPPKPEQKRIAERLANITARVETERNLVSKLRAQKAGLMQDLLTGKVRVKSDKSADEASEAAA